MDCPASIRKYGPHRKNHKLTKIKNKEYSKNRTSKTPSKEKKTLRTFPPLAQCIREKIKHRNTLLPNKILLVESRLPIKEAENSQDFLGEYIFCQVLNKHKPKYVCLLCTEKNKFHTQNNLEAHYFKKHEFICDGSEAQFNEKVIFVQEFSKDVRKNTKCRSFKCQFCQLMIAAKEEIRLHYAKSHGCRVKFLPKSDMETFTSHFHCSLCEHSSHDFLIYMKHIKQCHNMQTYLCKECKYCSPNPDCLRNHFMTKHYS